MSFVGAECEFVVESYLEDTPKIQCWHSREEVWSHIDALWKRHKSKHPDVGMGVLIQRRSRAAMRIGFSDEGWYLEIDSGAGVCVLGNGSRVDGESGESQIEFYMPDAHFLSVASLHPTTIAKNFVDHWLEFGQVSLHINPLDYSEPLVVDEGKRMEKMEQFFSKFKDK